MLKNAPLISIVMPVYNAGQYLPAAIESILNQTFKDFEFLIFDDGSTDNSVDIIREYAKRDQRILPFFSDVNKGYVVHLNTGITVSKGQFVARMDSDDIAMEERLQSQIDFLETNRKVAVVGSSIVAIDEDGNELHEEGLYRTSSSEIFWQSFFTNPLAHPTVMIRAEIFNEVGFYTEEKIPAEDYDLWMRILRKSLLANISKPLLKYRIHNSSISFKKADARYWNALASLKTHWDHWLDLQITEEEVNFFHRFHLGYDKLNPSSAFHAFRKLKSLFNLYKTKQEKLESTVIDDFFKKSLYLATKSRTHSFYQFLQILAYLLIQFPYKTIMFIIKRKYKTNS